MLSGNYFLLFEKHSEPTGKISEDIAIEMCLCRLHVCGINFQSLYHSEQWIMFFPWTTLGWGAWELPIIFSIDKWSGKNQAGEITKHP